MSDDVIECAWHAAAKRFAYRLLYLRPSDYSDERVAIGVVADGLQRLEVKFISSAGSLDLLARLFGDEGVEQYQFAAAEVRRALTRPCGLDEFQSPTDLLVLGGRVSATTMDRNGLLLQALEAASCLVREGSARSREVFASHTVVRLTSKLLDSVSKVDPLLANRIFRQKCTLPSGEVVELPICGDKIFGAPVSFAGPTGGIYDQKMRAEAMVAKFQVYRKYLRQVPKLYLLTPAGRWDEVPSPVIQHVNELRQVAEASSVALSISGSTDALALSLIDDESRAA